MQINSTSDDQRPIDSVVYSIAHFQFICSNLMMERREKIHQLFFVHQFHHRNERGKNPKPKHHIANERLLKVTQILYRLYTIFILNDYRRTQRVHFMLKKYKIAEHTIHTYIVQMAK